MLTRPQVSAALFEPPPFQPQKLAVTFLPGGAHAGARAALPASRRYTLTHNDVTGALTLSIGPDYNARQVQGFYTRILRDEITAEWLFAASCSRFGSSSSTGNGASSSSSTGNGAGGGTAPAELHVYCHVSGEERWLAPPQLRNFIFRREMTLVRPRSACHMHAAASCSLAQLPCRCSSRAVRLHARASRRASGVADARIADACAGCLRAA